MSNSTIQSGVSDPPCAISAADPNTPLWLEQGGFIPVLLGIAVMFWGISFVCEEYGVPSITAFCKRNNLSDSLTGSIFIGTGLSLPVFFIALAGLFASHSAIGVGAVVGGNLFNHLFTIATSIYVCPNRTMKLDGIVFTREMLLYFLSCILVLWATQNANLTHAFNDSFSSSQWQQCLSIPWEYSLVLVMAYVAYCLIDSNFYLLENCLQQYYPRSFKKTIEEVEIQPIPSSSMEESSLPSLYVTTAEDILKENTLGELTGTQHHQNKTETEKIEHAQFVEDILDEERQAQERKSHDMIESVLHEIPTQEDILSFPTDVPLLHKSFFLLTYPLRYAMVYTIPDVRRPATQSYAILSMSMVILWLGVLSYVLTISLTLLGDWIGIDGSVMGFTVAAWASNFPAHWSSIVVSRHGFGDISCCNCLGSNIFNNLIGLGLPWLLYNIVYGGIPYQDLQDDGVAISIYLMMITIVVHYIIMWFSNWTLREWMIWPMFLAYTAEIFFLCYFDLAVL